METYLPRKVLLTGLTKLGRKRGKLVVKSIKNLNVISPSDISPTIYVHFIKIMRKMPQKVNGYLLMSVIIQIVER